MKDKIFRGILAISIGLLIVAIAFVGCANAINNTTHIVINAFDQNPHGVIDHRYEWVALYNPTNNSEDLTNWSVSLLDNEETAIPIPDATIIAPGTYWTYIPGKRWLGDNNKQITLKDPEGNIIDQTLIVSDTLNDNQFWKRCPDGFDTDSDSDWKFGLQPLEKGVMRKGTVTYVQDGDTIDISPVSSKATEFLTETNGGTRYFSTIGMAGVQRVRLLGIDAPELKTDEGNESKAFLEGLCSEEEVWFDVDDRKQYEPNTGGAKNRILAMVYAYLFSIEDGTLEEGQVPEMLKEMFENNGIPLSETAIITKENDGKWLMTDKENKNTYLIIKEEGTLNIYTNLNQEMLRNGYAEALIIPPSEFVPYANFIYSPPNPVVNQSIIFDGSPSWTFDPTAAIISYEWDFGDGTKGTGMIVTHTYPTPGNYIVSLKVTDSNGYERRDNTRNKTVTVSIPPIAYFSYTPRNPSINKTITFNASESTDPDGAIEDYTWDFGDGATGRGKMVTHTYSSVGNYTVKLTVTDNEGAINTSAKEILIEIPTVSIKNPSEVSENENFSAIVNINGIGDLAILMIELSYNSSVIALTNVEKGSDLDISGWSHWYGIQNTGMATIFAASDPSGSAIKGSAELVRLEFTVVGKAGNKSAFVVNGILGNSDVEPIEAKWMPSELTVTL